MCAHHWIQMLRLRLHDLSVWNMWHLLLHFPAVRESMHVSASAEFWGQWLWTKLSAKQPQLRPQHRPSNCSNYLHHYSWSVLVVANMLGRVQAVVATSWQETSCNPGNTTLICSLSGLWHVTFIEKKAQIKYTQFSPQNIGRDHTWSLTVLGLLRVKPPPFRKTIYRNPVMRLI